MADILLATINAKWIHPSLALRLLRANLSELEERSSILEFALRQPLSDKIAGIIEAKPRILALSVSIWNHEASLELLRALKEQWAGSPPLIVLGGPEASNLAPDAELLAECDYLVCGEGEHAFRELCRALLRGEKGGDGGTGYTRIEAGLVDPASIESAYRLYTDEDLHRKLTYVEASRGCPFGCEFCLSFLDRKVRDFDLDRFLNEMDGLIQRGARSFKFLDRTFNLDLQRSRAIMEFFLSRAQDGLYVHFEMVPSRFPLELRETLKKFTAGSLRLEVGIQTFNPEVAATIGRPSNPERELEAIRFLTEQTNAIVHADLIAGLPGESFSSFAEGFDRLWKARPSEIQLGVLKRLPGTPLCRHDAPYGMKYATEPPYEVISTKDLSEAELNTLKNFARFWELIVNRGHFEELVVSLLPKGSGAFVRFLALSNALLEHFGKNWGIDRAELRAFLREEAL
ncbi:hypothetical protein MASR2M78_11500 [Treponema sp.]